MNKIIERLICDCNPGKVYASKSTFNTHKKSKRHKAWETKNQELDHRKTITRLQNEIESLKIKNGILEEKFSRLDERHIKLKGMYLKVVKG